MPDFSLVITFRDADFKEVDRLIRRLSEVNDKENRIGDIIGDTLLSSNNISTLNSIQTMPLSSGSFKLGGFQVEAHHKDQMLQVLVDCKWNLNEL